MSAQEEVAMRIGLVAAAKVLEKNPNRFAFAKLVVEEQSAAIHKLAQTTDDKLVHQANVTLVMLKQKISPR